MAENRFAQFAQGNRFAAYEPEKPKRSQSLAEDRKGKKTPLRRVDAAMRGAADFLTLGFSDEIAAAGDAIPAFIEGGLPAFEQQYLANVEDQRAMDTLDRRETPVSRGAGQATGFVASLFTPSGISRTASLPVRMAQGGAVGGAYSGGAAMGNAQGDVGERAVQAIPAAALGLGLGAAAVPLADAVGRGFNALTSRGNDDVGRTANALTGRMDPQQAATRAAERRAAGVEPAAVNAMDDGGRGFVAALAKRQTPGREIVQQRADQARVNLADRVSNQARRLSTDPRNPLQIADDLGNARRAQGNIDFGAVRNERVALTDDAVAALRTQDGRDAIRQAAAASLRSLDPDERAIGAELNRLAGDALDQPGQVQITVGMAQSISESLFDAADAAARAGRNRMAASLGDLGRAVRNNAADAVPGYRTALDNYAAQSALMEAADAGEDFLRRNTDEFVAAAPAPGQPGNDLARAAARRAIERQAGESPAGALSTAERIAIAPEQMRRTRALLPEADAQALERGMGAEVRQYRELQQVAPRAGSPTNLNTQDQQAAAGVADTVSTVLGGPKAWTAAVIQRLRTLGINDRDAAAVADIATDPARLDDLIARMNARQQGSGQQLLEAIAPLLERYAGEATMPPPTVEVYGPGGAYGASYGPAGLPQ